MFKHHSTHPCNLLLIGLMRYFCCCSSMLHLVLFVCIWSLAVWSSNASCYFCLVIMSLPPPTPREILFFAIGVSLSVCLSDTHIGSIALKPFKIFSRTWYKCKASSEDVQRIKTVTLPTILVELCLFVFISMSIVPALYLKTAQDIFRTLDTNVKYYQTMCGKQGQNLYLHF